NDEKGRNDQARGGGGSGGTGRRPSADRSTIRIGVSEETIGRADAAGIGAAGARSDASAIADESSAPRIEQGLPRLDVEWCMGQTAPSPCGHAQSSNAGSQIAALPPAWHKSQTAISGPSARRNRTIAFTLPAGR